LQDHRLLIISDHGFRTFEHKVHLNHWLTANGYMALADHRETPELKDVHWEASRAYALGLNSVYLNVAGREGKGIVTPEQIEPLLDELKQRLLDWKTDDGRQIISRVLLKHEAFTGPYTRFGPDLVMGYAPGFRASSETGLGKSLRLHLNPTGTGGATVIDLTIKPAWHLPTAHLKNMPVVLPRYPIPGAG
jgi:predicted AlkP superfamily phosphohydrolase/phosphomutase